MLSLSVYVSNDTWVLSVCVLYVIVMSPVVVFVLRMNLSWPFSLVSWVSMKLSRALDSACNVLVRDRLSVSVNGCVV